MLLIASRRSLLGNIHDGRAHQFFIIVQFIPVVLLQLAGSLLLGFAQRLEQPQLIELIEQLRLGAALQQFIVVRALVLQRRLLVVQPQSSASSSSSSSLAVSYSCPPPAFFPNPTPPGCADGTCNPAPPSIPNSCACGDVGSQGPTAPGMSGTPADGALAGAMAAILAVGGGMPGTINTPPGGVSPSSCPSGSSGSCPSGSCGTGTGSGGAPGGPGAGGNGFPAGGIGGFPAGGNGGFSPSGNGGGGGSSGSCPGSAGVCGVNPAAGNLLLQIGPPSAGGFDPGSLLSYNSLAASSASGAYGAGWTATYNRYIRKLSSTVAQVVDSVGNVFNYTLPGSGTRYTPPQAPITAWSSPPPAAGSRLSPTAWLTSTPHPTPTRSLCSKPCRIAPAASGP